MASTTTTPTHSHTTTATSRTSLGASRDTALRRFSLHYLEMVVAMVAGMVILGPLESLVLDAAGRSAVLDNAAASVMVMATNMTVAMAG